MLEGARVLLKSRSGRDPAAVLSVWVRFQPAQHTCQKRRTATPRSCERSIGNDFDGTG
jgi:hypothetical protein